MKRNSILHRSPELLLHQQLHFSVILWSPTLWRGLTEEIRSVYSKPWQDWSQIEEKRAQYLINVNILTGSSLFTGADVLLPVSRNQKTWLRSWQQKYRTEPGDFYLNFCSSFPIDSLSQNGYIYPTSHLVGFNRIILMWGAIHESRLMRSRHNKCLISSPYPY